MSNPTEVLADTDQGPVRGVLSEHGAVFRGVPYAAPPVGDLRFTAPQAHQPWDDVLDATLSGPTAPQPASGRLDTLLPTALIPGQDYLNLNVWSPDLSGTAPVIVFIHGGSFVTGSGGFQAYDGSSFSRDGVVWVSINYRLGVEGFLWFGEGTPNLGLLDQVAALRWVAANIANFGGDPQQVTVMGESAGAMSIAALLAMPAARGLFRRAIMESGAALAMGPATAIGMGQLLADLLRISPTRAALATVPRQELLAAQQTLTEQAFRGGRRKFAEVAKNLLAFEPVVDGEILPRHPLEAVGDSDVDLLIGHNREEARLFFSGLSENGPVTLLATGLLARKFEVPLQTLNTYRRRRRAGTHLDLLSDVFTDGYYRMPAIAFAQATGAVSWFYRFDWPTPALDGKLRACHVLELPFVLDAMDNPVWQTFLGGKKPRDIATRMHRAWVRFAADGNPGWEPYTPTRRAEQVFDDTDVQLVDPDADLRRLWELQPSGS